jgi:hypothetical protein
LICGYSSERKHIVVIQAFVDDSRSESGDREIVLAGYMSSASEWLRFSEEWSAVLAAAPSIEFFHANEAHRRKGPFQGWKTPARDMKVEQLVDVIERHRLASFDTRMSLDSFKRILLPISPYDLKSPYLILFQAVMANAAMQLHSNGLTIPIDFVFDEQGEIGAMAALWHRFSLSSLPPHLRPLLGSSPIFCDDKKMVPLQAADMLAWHLRRSRELRFKDEVSRLNRLRRHLHTEMWVPDEFLQNWADAFAMMPGIHDVRKHSVKKEIAAIDAHIKRLPKQRQNEAYEEFAAAMEAVLHADPREVKAAMGADKQVRALEAERTGKRGRGRPPKHSSASSHTGCDGA